VIKDVIESIDQFWELSWFELHLLMARYNDRQERRKNELEMTVYNPVRILWSTIMNRHRGKSEPHYKPTDLFHLPFLDGQLKPEEKLKKVDMKKVIERLGKQFTRNN
jgi:hypothetical protein